VALPVCINRANVTVLSLGHVKGCVSFVKSAGLAGESLDVNAAGEKFLSRRKLKKQNSLAFAPINALIFLLMAISRQIFLTDIPNVSIRLYLRL
jgi:hypothetical protein